MAITRPLTATSGGSTSSTASSFTVTDPGAIGTDDVVIVAVSTRRDRTVTTPSGWSVLGPVQAGAVDGTGINLYVFWQRGEPSTWSFSLSASSTGWAWICDVFSGVDTTGDPWVSNASADGTDASVDVPALSSLPSGCTAVAFGAYRDNGAPRPTSWGTDPGGYASITESNFDDSQGVLLAVDDLGSGTSVSAATWTLDVTPNRWAAQVVALEPATTAVDYDITPTGSITATAGLVRSIAQRTTGTTTPAGSIIKSMPRTLIGSTTGAGSLAKNTGKAAAGSTTPAGTLASLKAIARSLAGSIAPTGVLAKNASKATVGSITATSTVVRSIARSLAGATTAASAIVKATASRVAGGITPSGALAALKVIAVTLTGSITAASTLTKGTGKATTGSTTPSSSQARATAKRLASTVAAAGAVAKLSASALAGTITSAGALTKNAAKAAVGSTSASSATARSTDKSTTGTIDTSSSIGKAIGSFFAGVVTAAADLSRILNGTGGTPSPGPVDRHSDPIPVMMYREPSIDQWQEKSKTERWQPQ